MPAVSRNVRSLQRIDFAESLLRNPGILIRESLSFEQPGALGVARVSFTRQLQTFKPAQQRYHGIGYRISGARTRRLDMPRGRVLGSGHAGMTAIVPAEEESRWEASGANEMLHFYLPCWLVADLAEEIYGVDGRAVQMIEGGYHHDNVIARHALSFSERLREAATLTELEMNATAQLLGAHLLRRYSTLSQRPVPAMEGTLGTQALQRVIDYMHANLEAPLRLAELGAVAGLSQFRFARAFRRSTGTSPHQYVIRLRLQAAQDLLTGSSEPLSAIAALTGFSSQSHLNAVFQRTFGTTPGRYRALVGRPDPEE